MPEFLPQNVAGAGMGAINALGAPGGFAGPYIVGALGGGTGASFLFLAASLLAAGLLMLIVRAPRRRSRSQPGPGASPAPQAGNGEQRQPRDPAVQRGGLRLDERLRYDA